MKEERFLDNLDKLFSKEEIASLMDEEINVPVPEKIQKMIDRTRKNLSNKPAEKADIIDFINQEDSVPLAECALEGSEERERSEDPLKDIVDKDES